MSIIYYYIALTILAVFGFYTNDTNTILISIYLVLLNNILLKEQEKYKKSGGGEKEEGN